MARAATCADVFNAIAEPKRREIVAELRGKEACSVNELVEKLGMSQPAVSKHLGVLRKVGLVTAIQDGRYRYYRLDPTKLKPMHDWVAQYECFWTNQIGRIKERAEQAARKKETKGE